MERNTAKASIHFKDDTASLVPYLVIIKDTKSPALKLAAFSLYGDARQYATVNAKRLEFDCGENGEHAKQDQTHMVYECEMCGHVLASNETLCPKHPNAALNSIRVTVS